MGYMTRETEPSCFNKKGNCRTAGGLHDRSFGDLSDIRCLKVYIASCIAVV